MLQRITIGRHERGLLYKDADYARTLRPGAHWLWGFGRTVKKVATTTLTFAAPDMDVLLRDPELWEDVIVVDLPDDERALVWVDGRVHGLLGKGRTVFWKDLHEVRVEVVKATPLRFEHPLLATILDTPGGKAELTEVTVPKGARGLVYINERLDDELGPGRYAFWKGAGRVTVDVVDLREVQLDVAGQEILTADKVSLRLNLTAAYRVVDLRRAAEATSNVGLALYRELQLALREAVGGRTLDALLSAKDEVGKGVLAAVAPKAQSIGVSLGSVGLKDIILPGEMKTLLNQVIEAEKRAQANLIARREETAATRSLLNTAKLIEQSPVLLRLKEMEAAERVASQVGSVQIVGLGVDALLGKLLPPTT
jgi:regulator of protease activity HflC (stomatin/prohibitin superfamily)